MSVSVIIGTYGNLEVWGPRAKKAYTSAKEQTCRADEIFWVHGPTLHQARNAGADQSTSEWLIFLDADDTLDPYYIQMMLEAEGDIRYPSTLGVVDGVEDDYPVLAKPRDLKTGNFITIGAMVRRMDFLDVGGFSDLPCLEDWELFLKLWSYGCEIGSARDAIYRINVRPDSRNKNEALHLKVYQQIRRRFQDCHPFKTSV